MDELKKQDTYKGNKRRHESSTLGDVVSKSQKLAKEKDIDVAAAGCSSDTRIKQRKQHTKKSQTIVYFDLETTGLDVNTDSLTQIAAIGMDDMFAIYVRPTCPIGEWARENTYINYNERQRTMYYRDQKVPSKKPKNALRDFISYLKSFRQQVILAAHNCHKYDALILYNQLVKYDLWEEFIEHVYGFSDTLPMFQNMLKLQSYRLDFLASKYLPDEEFALHNAVDDTRILKSLVDNVGNESKLKNEFLQTCSMIQEQMNLE